jgi:hypothetical protein
MGLNEFLTHCQTQAGGGFALMAEAHPLEENAIYGFRRNTWAVIGHRKNEDRIAIVNPWMRIHADTAAFWTETDGI